ncbi:hypothetical protein NL676_006870 [Syzygium grande]|nr:hypothetical protein NL676_006870 [Syzygium grande]
MSKNVLARIKPLHSPTSSPYLKPHLKRFVNETIRILSDPSPHWQDSLGIHFAEAEILVSDVAHHVFDRVYDAGLALRFFLWASEQRPQRGSLGESGYSSLLKLLAKCRLFPEVELVRSGMASEEIEPTREAVNALIRSYAGCGMIHQALRCYDAVRKVCGRSPDVFACNCLLNALVNGGQTRDARRVFDEMLDRENAGGVDAVNNFSVCIMVRGLCSEGKTEEGEKMIQDRWGHGCIPNVVFYNTLIDGYVKIGNVDKAHALFKELVSKGFLPTLQTFGSMIRGFCNAGKFDLVDKLITEMEERGLSVSLYIYNTIISGLYKHGRAEEAVKMVENMVQSGCEPDIVTYNILIASLCKDGRLREAEGFLGKALTKGFTPNKLTCNPLILAYCRQGEHEKASNLLIDITERGEKLDMITYGALIHGSVLLGEIDVALTVYRKMMERGVFPDAGIYNVLLSGLCKKSRLEAAKLLLMEMLDHNINPDEYVFVTIVDGYARHEKITEAKDVFEFAIKKGLNLGVVGYNAMIRGYCRLGMMKDAMSYFHGMLKEQLMPDEITYTTIIDGYGKQQDLEKAMRMFRQMIMRKCKPNVVTYTSLIDGFCRSKNLDKAEDLFFEMKSSGLEPNVVTYSILIGSSFKEGRPEKAASFFELMLENNCSPNDVTLHYLVRGLINNISSSTSKIANIYQEEKRIFLKLFRDMILDQWAPQAAAYSVILICLCQHKMVKDALKLYDKETKKGLLPDPVLLASLLHGISLEGQSQALKGLNPCKLSKEDLKVASKYSSMLDKYMYEGRSSEASYILQTLVANHGSCELEVHESEDCKFRTPFRLSEVPSGFELSSDGSSFGVLRSCFTLVIKLDLMMGSFAETLMLPIANYPPVDSGA